MEQKKEKGLRIRSCLTGAIWLALVFSTVISALLFAFLNHFFNLPGSIPVLGWLLIFNTLIAGLITSFINAKLLEPITRLSKAMKKVSQGDFELRNIQERLNIQIKRLMKKKALFFRKHW